jgi:hypothetical protein
MKHGDQICEMDLCVLICGMKELFVNANKSKLVASATHALHVFPGISVWSSTSIPASDK